MKLKITNLWLALTLSIGFASAQYTTDGIYTIQNVASSMYITNPGTSGSTLTMTDGSGTDIQWIIQQNGTNFNIISTDEQFLAASDGAKGLLLDNNSTNRDNATGGALVSITDVNSDGANPYRFESSTPTDGLEAWNGRRTSNTQVGIGTGTFSAYEWDLVRVADLPDNTPGITDGVYTIFLDNTAKYMTRDGDAGSILDMTTQTDDATKWIIKQNKYDTSFNIISYDFQFLAASDGAKGILLENTLENRDNDTGGALVTISEVSVVNSNPYYFETWVGSAFSAWNGQRNSSTQVGMGTGYTANYEWTLTRVADIPSNTWTGTNSTAWEDAGNWSTNAVPSGELVIIPAAANQPMISTADATVYDLTLEDGSVVTVSGGYTLTVNGDLVVPGTGYVTVSSGSSLLTYGAVEGTGHVFARSTTFDNSTGKYSVVGSPVEGAMTSALGNLVYDYNEVTHSFDKVTSVQPMTGGDAYFSAFTGDISFTGTPHTGDVAVALSYNAADGSNTGFNLVSNPYPAAVAFSSFVNGNTDIDGTIYIWDDGGSDAGQRTSSDYITVNAVGSVSGGSSRSGDFNGFIGSAQGFFVVANKESAMLNFNDSMKVAGNNADANFFRQAPASAGSIESLRLSLSNMKGVTNQSLIGFAPNATDGYDRLYDARKMDGANGVKIYTMLDGEPMSIQGLPFAEETVVPLGMSLTEAGEYTLNLDYIKNWSEGKAIYLEDTKLNEIIDLASIMQYTFYSEVASNETRFNLIISEPKAEVLAADALVNGWDVHYTRNGITVVNATSEVKSATVTVVDLSGSLLLTEHLSQVKDGAHVNFQFDTKKVYIIRFTSGSGSFFSKILFN